MATTTAPAAAPASATIPSRRRPARDLAVVSAIYAASFLIVDGFPRIPTAFPLDDSWIHQVVARNLAEYHTLGFVPGVWSSGSSSLLWTLILALKWILAPSLNPVLYCDGLNLLLLTLTGAGLLGIARKEGLAEPLCWIVALAPALDGNFVWLAATGMEHLLFVALSIAAIYLWFDTRKWSAVAASLCLGALSLTRPEGLALAGILLLTARRGHSRKDVAILCSVVSAAVLLFLFVNLKTSHSWLPATYAGRKWLYFGSAHVPLARTVAYPALVLLSTLLPWKVTGPSLLFVVPATLLVLGFIRFSRRCTPRFRVLCLWALVLVGAYAVMLPSLFDEGRYQAMLLCLSLPLEFAGLEWLLSRVPRNFARAALIGLCLLCAGRSLSLWRQVTRAGVTLVQDTHQKAAAYIASSLPANARIAALDIGAVAYADGPQRIVDLGGLTDSSYLPYLMHRQIGRYLRGRGAPYLMWVYNPDGTPDMPNEINIRPQLGIAGAERLAVFCAPRAAWLLTRYHAQCQAIYQLRRINTSTPQRYTSP